MSCGVTKSRVVVEHALQAADLTDRWGHAAHLAHAFGDHVGGVLICPPCSSSGK
jgi:hypothetical protein